MKKNRTVRSHKIYEKTYPAFLAAILTAILFTLIIFLSGRMPGGEKIFLYGDGYYQGNTSVHMFWRHLLEGRSWQYTFENSMGLARVSQFGVGILSPFHVLYLVIKDYNLAAFVVSLSKLMSAAALFTVFLRLMEIKSNYIVVLCAVAYVLCGFIINFYYIGYFLDAMYLLPLICIAIMHFVATEKWKWLCIAYTLLFFEQIFLGYLIGIFSFVFFVSILVKKTERISKRTLAEYFLCVVLALMMCMAVVLPAGIWMLENVAGDRTPFEGISMKWYELPFCFFAGQTQGMDNRNLMGYSGVIILMLIPFFGQEKSISLREKISFFIPAVFLVLCTVVPVAYLAMHAFDAPDGYAFRFAFFYPFVFLQIAAKELQDGELWKNKKAVAICVGVWTVVYATGILQQQKELEPELYTMTTKGLVMNFSFLIVYALLLSIHLPYKKWIMLAVLSMELVCNGVWILTPDSDDFARTRKYYDLWQEQTKGGLAYIEEQEKEDTWPFYRIYFQNCFSNNISMLYGYHGIGAFGTEENAPLRYEMQKLGYAGSPRLLRDEGSTPFTRMLFAQKYSILAGKPGTEYEKYYSVVKNEHTLPLGYMVSERILEYKADSSSAFENQNRLAEAMLGKAAAVWIPQESDVTVTRDGTEFIQHENGFHVMLSGNNTAGRVLYHFPQERGLVPYAYFSRWGYSANDKRSALLWSPADQGEAQGDSVLYMPHILPMGKNEAGEWECAIILNEHTYSEATYENQYFAYFDETVCEAVWQELDKNVWDIAFFSDDDIRGTVLANDDKNILFTSIPYDKYWRVEIDGSETVPIAVMDEAFLALKLEPGQHQIHMYYRDPWCSVGRICSLIGLGIFVLFIWMDGLSFHRLNANIDGHG